MSAYDVAFVVAVSLFAIGVGRMGLQRKARLDAARVTTRSQLQYEANVEARLDQIRADRIAALKSFQAPARKGFAAGRRHTVLAFKDPQVH